MIGQSRVAVGRSTVGRPGSSSHKSALRNAGGISPVVVPIIGSLLLAACAGSDALSIEDQAATIVAATAAAASPTPTPLPPTATITASPTPTPTETPSPTPSPTPFAGGGWIIFTSKREGQFDLFLIRPDGSEEHNLTNSDHDECCPAWSPSGERLVYTVSTGTPLWGLYVSDASGNEARLLAHGFGGYASWSPDHDRIVISNGGSLHVLEISDGRKRVIRPAKQHTRGHLADLADSPDWSPAGNDILFVWNELVPFQSYFIRRLEYGWISLLPVDGDHEQRMTPGEDPAWSPDGERIAYILNRDLYVMDRAGLTPQQLTDDSAEDAGPTWSPDGMWIAFASKRSGNWDIYIIPSNCFELPEGCEALVRQLTFYPARDEMPDWSP